jgi:hypothetical protein
MIFTLEKRKGYKFKFSTNIKFKEILKDLEDNKMTENVVLKFDKDFYIQHKKFYVVADNFENTVSRLKEKLEIFQIES